MREHNRIIGQFAAMSVQERAQRYLACCDPAVSGAGGHDTTFRVACTLLHGFCLSPTEAFQLLKLYNEKCQPPWSDAELRHKILSAGGVGSSKGRGYLLSEGAFNPELTDSAQSPLVSLPAPKWPVADLIMIERLVRDGPGGYDLWESSSVHWEDSESHAEEIIDLLFSGDPLLCCGWSARNFETRKRSAWRGLLSSMPLIAPNPMVSLSGLTKDGKESQHTLEATSKRIYQVVEFDFSAVDRNGTPTIYAPLLERWRADGISTLDVCAALSAHLARRLPSFVLFLDSGGKSGHSWFNVRGLPICAQRDFFRQTCLLGADPQLWCRCQFVRLPDGRRENGRRQTVLYFNPQNAINP
jgi:hypothetical protein